MNQFRPSIDVLLRVFAFVVAFSVANFWNSLANQKRPWINFPTLIMLLALLLRFFLGAANHLEKTYCRHKLPNKKILSFLWNYFAALAFGSLIMWMAGSSEFRVFLFRGTIILSFGLLLSVIHLSLYRKRKADMFYQYWLIINAVQLFATWFCYFCSDFSDTTKAVFLSVLYVLMLVVDLGLLLLLMGQRTITDGI
jgi:hypothetical protein